MLLKNYYGTGHFSLDNYISLVSGQATQPDTQADCPYYDQFSGTIDTSGTLDDRTRTTGRSPRPPARTPRAGANGCVYRVERADAVQPARRRPRQLEGLRAGSDRGPGRSLGRRPVLRLAVRVARRDRQHGAAEPGQRERDRPVRAEALPVPVVRRRSSQSGDCNAAHIADVFDPSNGLYHDLQSESTTPAFSWISPNNCSDAHDAVCKGNNLSGGFSDPNTPNPPKNYTGGLYAADLFLEHVIPEIEESPAFKDGGLIDVTFDEAFPPFTFTGNSFANSTIDPAERRDLDRGRLGGRDDLRAHRPLRADRPEHAARDGLERQPALPGPGLTTRSSTGPPTAWRRPSRRSPPAPASSAAAATSRELAPTPARSAAAGVSTIRDDSIVATDAGPLGHRHGHPGGRVRRPRHRRVERARHPGGRPRRHRPVHARRLVGQRARRRPAPVSGVTLGARTPATDPLYDATDATTGGGDTGSVLISPYIRPGTVSTVYYNHYSWLRTMEDLFNVGDASQGLDGAGPPRLRGPAGARPVRVRRVQQPVRAH